MRRWSAANSAGLPWSAAARGVAAALVGKLITVDGNEGEVREGDLTLSAWSEDDTPELRELADIARRDQPGTGACGRRLPDGWTVLPSRGADRAGQRAHATWFRHVR